MNRPPVHEADVQLAQNGSADAFERIVRTHQRSVRAFVARHIADRHAADEVAQDVFVAAHRSLATFDGRGDIGAWLLGIARHHVLTCLRRSKKSRIRSLGDALDTASLDNLLDGSFDAKAETGRVDALKTCLQSLDDSCRELVIRFYYESDTAEAIAGRLGKSPGTIRMALLRIRKKLRLCIEGRLAAGGSGA